MLVRGRPCCIHRQTLLYKRTPRLVRKPAGRALDLNRVLARGRRTGITDCSGEKDCPVGVSAAAIGAAGNGMEIGAAEAKIPQFAIAESRQFLDLSRPPAARSPGRTKAARPRLQ